MAWPASAQTALDNGPAGSSGCVDDTWAAISTVMAPSPRSDYAAVWTGSEMIVWGGYDGSSYLNTGGRYDPDSDSWTPINTVGAPSPRAGHTAVWTGKEMIVWGGGTCGVRELLVPTAPSSTCTYLKTGARYDPTTDSWVATTLVGAPTGRALHTAVWTGTEMIVWGRINNTGSRYDPQTDTWRLTRIADAPSPRLWHTAVWIGTEMVIWGGGMGDYSHVTNTGGRYQPGKSWTTDTWRPTSMASAPSARELHTAVWTGQEMIVWAGNHVFVTYGSTDTGGRYNPATDTWTGTSTAGAPSPRIYHSAVWTGSEMIVWGGQYGDSVATGGRYDPATATWAASSRVNAPSARQWHTTIWTGTEMIVWGGVYRYYDPASLDYLSVYQNTGGRYCARR